MEKIVNSVGIYFSFCRIIGIFTFSLNKNGVKFSKWNFMQILLILTFWTFNSYRGFKNIMAYQEKGEKKFNFNFKKFKSKFLGATFSYLINFFGNILRVAMMMIIFLTSIVFNQEFLRIAKLFAKFDSAVRFFTLKFCNLT
jgi:hypothetical protein